MKRQILIVLTQEDDSTVTARFAVEPGIPFEQRGTTEIEQVAKRMLDASGVVAERVPSHAELGYANRQAFMEQIQAFIRESDKCTELLHELHTCPKHPKDRMFDALTNDLRRVRVCGKCLVENHCQVAVAAETK